jgi:hypothetical protein
MPQRTGSRQSSSSLAAHKVSQICGLNTRLALLPATTQLHRVANIRKHQLLKPEIKVMMTAVDSITPSNYVFEYLEIEAAEMQQMNLQLGFPGNMVHIIRPSSPLYNLSLQVRVRGCGIEGVAAASEPDLAALAQVLSVYM